MTTAGAVCALVANWYTAIALADGKNGAFQEAGTICLPSSYAAHKVRMPVRHVVGS
jgi:hypothetical protein